MALSTATITFNISDMLGVDFDARRTKIWVTTNVPGETVIDTVGNAIRLGSGTVTLNADGTGTAVVWIPGTGSNPASWQTYIHVDYPDRRARKVRDFGPFTITADANLADLIEEQGVPPEYLTTVTALLDGYLDEGRALLDAQIDLSGIDDSDSEVAALITGPTLGPLTRAALAANYATTASVAQAQATANAAVGIAIVLGA